MRFAKPPQGFRVNCLPEARADVERICNDDADCFAFKEAVVKRLCQTGHKEGEDLYWPELPGARIFKTKWTTEKRGVSVRILYRILGDSITFYRVELERDLQEI